MTESATWLEVAWTTIAVVAIGFTAWIIDDNARNFAAIRRAVEQGRAASWGPRWWVAVSSLVSSLVMFLVWMGFALMGVVAMSTNPAGDPVRIARASFINGWVLVALTSLLAAIQAWQVYARTKLRPMMTPAPTRAPGGTEL